MDKDLIQCFWCKEPFLYFNAISIEEVEGKFCKEACRAEWEQDHAKWVAANKGEDDD